MKKITKIAACGLLATLGLTAMASCGEGSSLAKEVVSKVILTQDGGKVSADFTIPKIVKHDEETYEVTWSSSDTSVLNIVNNNDTSFTADVKRPFGDESANAEIKLTASVTAGGKTAKSNFKVTVTSIDVNAALDAAIKNVGIKPSYGVKEEVELPTKSNEYKDEISFTYSLGGEYVSAKLEGNKLTLDPELGQESIAVKVKAKSGDKELEKDVNTKTSLKTVYLSVSDALNQPEGAKIYVQGKIKSIVNEKYGNMWITDDAGKEIQIYGLYKHVVEDYDNVKTKGIVYNAWEDFEKLAVDDYVYVYGARKTYNTTEEIENCVLMGNVKDAPVSTITEALETPKGELVTVYGEVKSVVSDKYGNIYLKDSEGNEIYLYRLYQGKVSECYPNGEWNKDAESTRYDEMKDKPVVGDVIAVYGLRDEYNGTKQIKNSILLYYISKADRGGSENPTTPVETEFTGVVTAIGFKAAKDGKMRCYVLVQNAESQAKFVYIEAPINDTNTEAAAKAAINEKFVVGKTVTVKGTSNDYNGLNQHVVAWDKLATNVTLGDAGTVPAALDVTAKVGKNDELKALQGVLVKVTGTYKKDGSNGVLAAEDNSTILVYYENGFLSTNPLSALKVGGKYTVTGYLNWYNKPQLSPIAADAVVVVDESGVEQTPTPTPTDPQDANVITITVDSLGATKQKYTDGEKQLSGTTIKWIEVGNYGDGLQFRNKTSTGGKQTTIFNSTAFAKKIVKIELTASSTKSVYDNADALIFTFGTAADALNTEVKLSTVKDQKTYTIIPEGDFTYFKLIHNITYAGYWSSIVITLAE